MTRHFNLAVYPSEASDHRETRRGRVFPFFPETRDAPKREKRLIGLRLMFLLRPKKINETSDALDRCLSTAS